MPLPKRQRRQKPADQLANLDEDLRRHLETGLPFFNEFATLEEMAAVWDVVGEELLAECVQRCPGERPYGWWLCQHRKERPVVATWATDEYVSRERERSKFGFLHFQIWSGACGHKSSYLQQNETAYLLENDLLEPGEFERFIERQRSAFGDTNADLMERTLRHDPKNPRLLYHILPHYNRDWPQPIRTPSPLPTHEGQS